jgi:hypothetical protein
MIALKKKPQATRCSDHRTIALSHIQQRSLEEGLNGKFRMYLEKISLDLEEEQELGI